MASTIDFHRKTHILTASIVSSESAEVYTRIFDTIKRIITQVNLEMKTMYIMSDGARAITRAAKNVFPGHHKLMCRFHAFFNIKKKITGSYLPEVSPASFPLISSEIRKGLSLLRSATNKPLHTEAWKIIKKHWLGLGIKRYTSYIEINYIAELSGWTNCHLLPALPSTNNGSETIYSIIKSFITERQKWNLSPNSLVITKITI